MHLKVTASTTAVIPRPQQSVRISSAFLSHDHDTILPLASATLKNEDVLNNVEHGEAN